MGFVIDKWGSKAGSIKNLIIIITMAAICQTSISILEYNWTSYAMCFVWGYLDGALNIHTLQILGFEFVSKSEPFGLWCLL